MFLKTFQLWARNRDIPGGGRGGAGMFTLGVLGGSDASLYEISAFQSNGLILSPTS